MSLYSFYFTDREFNNVEISLIALNDKIAFEYFEKEYGGSINEIENKYTCFKVTLE